MRNKTDIARARARDKYNEVRADVDHFMVTATQ